MVLLPMLCPENLVLFVLVSSLETPLSHGKGFIPIIVFAYIQDCELLFFTSALAYETLYELACVFTVHMHCTLKHWCPNPSVPVIHLWEHKRCWNCVHEVFILLFSWISCYFQSLLHVMVFWQAGECSVLQTHATSLVQVRTGWGGGDIRTEDLCTVCSWL